MAECILFKQYCTRGHYQVLMASKTLIQLGVMFCQIDDDATVVAFLERLLKFKIIINNNVSLISGKQTGVSSSCVAF